MKKQIINYFSSIVTLLGFCLGLLLNLIPFAILMFAAFTACLLWFTDIVRQRYSRARRVKRSSRPIREYNSIDIPLDDDSEEDKPDLKPAASNVRPGSRPSERYLKMVREARA